MYVAALNIISALDWTIYNFCIFCVRRTSKNLKISSHASSRGSSLIIYTKIMTKSSSTTTTPTMDHPSVLSPMTRSSSKSLFSSTKRRASPRPSPSKRNATTTTTTMHLNFSNDGDANASSPRAWTPKTRKKEGGGGSLPPSPVDENIAIDDDSEDGEMEVYEDAGTPFFAEEEEEEKDKNDENLAPFLNTEQRVEKGALNRALRRELYQLTKSRDEVSVELSRLRNEYERVQAMRKSELEALNMHKSRIADAAQATAKEANRVEEVKKDVIERERKMKEELEEAKRLRKEAEEMRVDAEEFLERQRRAEKAEAQMEEKGREIEKMKKWSNERMEELERKQEQVAVANAACEREASLLKRDHERFEKNRRDISRAFAKREMDAFKREEACEDRERRAQRATKMREEEERLLVEAQEKRFLAEKQLREFLEEMKEAESNAKKIEQAKEEARLKMRELDQLFSEKKAAIEQAEHALKKARVEREQIKEELDARERHTAAAAEAAAKECDAVANAWAKVAEGRKELEKREQDLKIASTTIAERLDFMKAGDEELEEKGKALEQLAAGIEKIELELKKDRDRLEQEKQTMQKKREMMEEAERIAKFRVNEIENRELQLDARENDVTSQLSRAAMVEENLKKRESDLRALMRSSEGQRAVTVRELESEVEEKTKEIERLKAEMRESSFDSESTLKKLTNEMDVLRESFRTKEIDIEAHRKALENQLNEARKENRDLVSEAAEARKERETALLRMRDGSVQTTTTSLTTMQKKNTGTQSDDFTFPIVDATQNERQIDALQSEIALLKREIASHQTHRSHLETQLAEARHLASANSPSGKTKKETERRKAWEKSAMEAVREARDALDARAETVKKAALDVKKREESAKRRENELLDGLERVEKEYAKARQAVAAAESERIDIEARREYVRREQLELEKHKAINDAFRTDEDALKKKLKAVSRDLEDAERKLENVTHMVSIRKQELSGLDLANINATRIEDLEQREMKIREFTDKVHPALLREAETLKEAGDVLQKEKTELQNSWLALQNREKMMNEHAETNNARIRDLKEFEKSLMQERDELLAFRDQLMEKQRELIHAEDVIERAAREKKALEKKRRHETREHTLDETKSKLKRLLTQTKTREEEAHRKLKRCETLLDRENIHNLRKSLLKVTETREALERDLVAVSSSSSSRRDVDEEDLDDEDEDDDKNVRAFKALHKRAERQLVRANDWFQDLQNELESYQALR